MDKQELINEMMDTWMSEYDKLLNIDIEKDLEGYKVQAERVTELDKRMVDILKSENEYDVKTDENKTRRKIEKFKSVTDFLKGTLTLAGAFAMGIISMNFEKADTVTSTAGKSSLRDVIKFKW